MPILDRHGRVWVPSNEASELYLAAIEVVKEFESLDGADVLDFPEARDLRAAIRCLQRPMGRVEKL